MGFYYFHWLCVLTIHLLGVIHSYFQYKTTEHLYTINHGYNFPDVTICNLNGISTTNLKYKAENIPEIEQFLNLSNKTLNPQLEGIPRKNDLFWSHGNISYKIGHSFQDVVIRCVFEYQPCKEDDFIFFQFSRFFNCYTFKKGRKTKSISQGAGAGLSLILYSEPKDPDIVEGYDYSFAVNNIDGFRIVITFSNSLAAVGVMGYDILPSHATSI